MCVYYCVHRSRTHRQPAPSDPWFHNPFLKTPDQFKRRASNKLIITQDQEDQIKKLKSENEKLCIKVKQLESALQE